MSDDTAVVDPPEATEPISTDLPDVEETPIEAQDSPASETTEEPAEEPKGWSLDEWKEHPQFKEWYKDHSQELQLNGQKREYGRTQETVKQVRAELLGGVGTVTEALNSFHSLAMKAIEMDGAEGFAAALAKNPAVLEQYRQAATLSAQLKEKTQGFDRDGLIDDVAMFNIGRAIQSAFEIIGKPEMAEAHIRRFADEYRFTEERGARAYEKVIKTVFKAGEEVGYKRGLGHNKDVTAEVQKGADRSGKSPAVAVGGTTNGRPTAAQYAAATSEQRAEWAKKGIDPIV